MATIRPAGAADLPVLEDLEGAADSLFTDRFGDVDWPSPTRGGERAAQPGILLVAVQDDGTVVGFTHVLDLAGRWHLDQVAVHPEQGRRGTGAALLRAAHEEVARRGGSEVTLMTYADVPWNAPFYDKQGYAVCEPPPAHLRPFLEAEERMGLARYGRRVAMAAAIRACEPAAGDGWPASGWIRGRLPAALERKENAMATRTWDAWNYRESAEVSSRGKDVTGFSVEAVEAVEAVDGSIGKIDWATLDVGSSYVVVDTGPWIVGRKVLLPAGTIDRVDWNEEKVHVDRTKDQIRDSPELDETGMSESDTAYRDRLGTYYGDTYDRGAL